jgi:Tannase and feruloyl esterase
MTLLMGISCQSRHNITKNQQNCDRFRKFGKRATKGRQCHQVRALTPASRIPPCRATPVPGPGTVDWTAVISDWVEHGKPPERIVATKFSDGGEVLRTRPLCVYPQRAAYILAPVARTMKPISPAANPIGGCGPPGTRSRSLRRRECRDAALWSWNRE